MAAVLRLADSRRPGRVDVQALKQANPIQKVVARYGIELRRHGRAAVGRCPFHADHGRPNLLVFSATGSWWCFRCNLGGDVIRFVELAEQVSFRDAVDRLGGAGPCQLAVRSATPASHAWLTSVEGREPDELTVLQAATSLYHHRLLTDPRALAYLAERGVERPTIDRYRVGYAGGDELLAYMRWQHLPLGPALGLGLLTRGGREFLAGRLVVPEVRKGRPVWLVGRRLTEEPSDEDEPKYLGLPGSKPLLG